VVTLYTNVVNGACCTRRCICMYIIFINIVYFTRSVWHIRTRKKKPFEWNDRRRSSIVAWLYYIIAMANSSNNNVILLCVRQHINGCAHSPRSLYCSAASPPNDDNDDNDYYSYYYYYDDDDDIITIIYNNNMVAMSISSRSRVRERFFILSPAGQDDECQFIHSFGGRPRLARHPPRGPSSVTTHRYIIIIMYTTATTLHIIIILCSIEPTTWWATEMTTNPKYISLCCIFTDMYTTSR
jgi:hypothetical protein